MAVRLYKDIKDILNLAGYRKSAASESCAPSNSVKASPCTKGHTEFERKRVQFGFSANDKRYNPRAGFCGKPLMGMDEDTQIKTMCYLFPMLFNLSCLE